MNSIEYFIENPSFQHWVNSPSQEDELFWQDYLKNHPADRENIAKAKLLLLHWERQKQLPMADDWDKLSQQISDKPIRKLNFNWQQIAVAASVVLCIGLGLFFTINNSESITYKTAFNQKKTFVLSDSSEVTLNANSELTLNADWNTGESRQVFLRGEGYFKVRKKAQKTPFEVHTEHLDVKVLGTIFNVLSRKNETNVMLEEGKVQVMTPTEKQLMQPNELITWTKNGLLKSSVSASDYKAWLRNELIFKGSTLIQVAQKLQDLYGYEMVLSPAISQKKFTAILPSQNPEVVLKAIITTFDLKMEKDGNKVILE
jgi:transmembrane sensor